MTTLNFLTKSIVSLVGVALIAATEAASAAVVTLNTSDNRLTSGVDNQGWWSTTLDNSESFNGNYLVGNSAGNVYRNFFTFDISTLPTTENIGSATLELRRFNSSQTNPTETLGLFDVSTDARTLNNRSGTNGGIFNDLGTGQSYGTFEVSTSGSSGDVLSFSLSSAAIADIQNAKNAGNQFFSIGGSLQNLNGSSNQNLFTGSSSSGTQSLRVSTVPVPEPLTILGSGMALGFGVLMNRQCSKKRKKI